MKKTKIILTAICVALVLGLGVVPAMAYFTDYTDAEGSVKVDLGYTTTMEEKVDGFVKTITISNAGPEACWVRARAFAGSDLSLTYSGTGWSENADGYWYYNEIIPAGGKTTDLKIEIGNIPKDAEVGDKLDVAVVYESAKVLYNADGTAKAGDFSMKMNVEGGNN